MPFAFFYALGTVMHALDDCRFREANDCHTHKLAYGLTVPIYAFTWFVYCLMVTRWIGNRNAVRSWVSIAWALCVFAYPIIESTVDPSGLAFFMADDLLPVSPALLLGFYLAARDLLSQAGLSKRAAP